MVGMVIGAEPIAHPSDTRTVINYWEGHQPNVWGPKFVQGQHFNDVPDHISRAASEAHKIRSVDALMSAVLMARTVIESVAKEKGITTGTLVKKIDELAKQNIIKEFTQETAHLIRTFGNDMAHGDISVDVDREDADGVLEFMDEFLNEVYQNPAKLAALQARAQARKAGNP